MTSLRRNPFVFVVGCPRSGTTLLQRMLDAHPSLTVANDTHFIARAVETVVPYWRDDPAAIDARDRELREWSRAYHRFPRLGLSREAVDRAAARPDGFAAFVGRVYDELAASRDKPYGGDKTPDYVSHLSLLHLLFPAARFVHIVRDGRDVALSLLEWATPTKGPGRLPFWSDDPLATSALWWRERVVAGRRDGAVLGDQRYLELRYEELVEEPERVLRGVARFLELPWSDRMLAFNRGRERDDAGLSAKAAWRGPTTGLRDWRRQLDAESVEVFAALAGDALRGAGYSLAPRRPSAAALARAERTRQAWRSHRREKSRKRERAQAGASAAAAEDHRLAP